MFSKLPVADGVVLVLELGCSERRTLLAQETETRIHLIDNISPIGFLNDYFVAHVAVCELWPPSLRDAST